MADAIRTDGVRSSQYADEDMLRLAGKDGMQAEQPTMQLEQPDIPRGSDLGFYFREYVTEPMERFVAAQLAKFKVENGTGSVFVKRFTSLPAESDPWQDIPGEWEDTEYIRIVGRANTSSDNFAIDAACYVGDIPESGNLWLASVNVGGQRLQIRRKSGAATTLQLSRAGAYTSATASVFRGV